MDLTSKSELMSVLSGFGFSFSKNLGQNFLIDKNILDKIASSSGADKNTNVLEIGPGAGTLTRELCRRAKKTVAVEIDDTLIPVINYSLSGFDNFKLIHSDILKLDLKQLILSEFKDEPFVVTANLPYYITTPIIMSFLEGDFNITSMTLMIQKEVAARIAAPPKTKEYGALSVAVQYRAEVKNICTAAPHCFIPQPKVTSSIIRLDIYDRPPYPANNEELFFKIVKSLFSQRRKTLCNSLSGSPFLKLKKENINAVLTEMGLDTKIRGEAMSIEQLVKFSDLIEEIL